jgi:acyl-CoA thioesterase-1
MRAGLKVSLGAAIVLAVSACGGSDAGAGGEARRPSPAEAGKERAPSAPASGATASGNAGSATPSTTPRRPGEPLRVLFVGTSLTAGLGLDPDDAYPNLLAQRAESAGFDVDVVNAGVSGETSAGTLRRTAWLLRSPVDVFVLETGANDGLRALDVDSTRANIEAIIRRVKAARPSARILLVQMEAPPNLGSGYTARFHAMFPEIARAENVTLVPFLLEGVAGRAELNQSDGIHPNVRGERIVADNVWPSLRAALEAEQSAAGVND